MRQSGSVVDLVQLFCGLILSVLPFCNPRDVGWFSHENPFEFDIHDFRYTDTALRFWGGTPSDCPLYCTHSHQITLIN